MGNCTECGGNCGATCGGGCDNRSRCGCGESGGGLCNCKLIGLHGTTAHQINDTTWEIYSDYPTKVISSDNSVLVTPQHVYSDDGKAVEYIWDLSVECCDQKVAVCAGGPSKFLKDTIDVVEPLQIDVDCATGKIVLSIDTDGFLNDVYSSCFDGPINDGDTLLKPSDLDKIIGLTSGYAWYDGPNQATANEIENPQPCDKRYLGEKCDDPCSCRRKGLAEIVLKKNFIIEQDVQTNTGGGSGTGNGFYAMVDAAVNGAISTISGIDVESGDRDGETAGWNIVHEYGGLVASDVGLICNNCSQARLVEINFNGSIEANWGVNGLRVQLYKICTDDTFEPVAEWRDSPISDPDADGDGLPDNYQITSAGSQSGSLNAGYQFQERQTFNLRRYVWMEPNCCIMAVFKVSTFNDHPDYNLNNPGQVGILGSLASDGTVSGDLGAFMSARTIDDCCIVQDRQEDCGCVSTENPEPLDSGETVDNGEVVDNGGGGFVLPNVLPQTGPCGQQGFPPCSGNNGLCDDGSQPDANGNCV